jgi:hypothetical protein
MAISILRGLGGNASMKDSLNDRLAAIQKRIEANRARAAAQEASAAPASPAIDEGVPLSQGELDLGLSPQPTQTAPAVPALPAPKTRRERSKLLPSFHADRDFFLCDLFDYALKDDGVSMEAPIFTLATKPDLSVWHWESKDGSRSVICYPKREGQGYTVRQGRVDLRCLADDRSLEPGPRGRSKPHRALHRL